SRWFSSSSSSSSALSSSRLQRRQRCRWVHGYRRVDLLVEYPWPFAALIALVAFRVVVVRIFIRVVNSFNVFEIICKSVVFIKHVLIGIFIDILLHGGIAMFVNAVHPCE